MARLASQPGANVRLLCRRFQISPTTGYKWLERYGGAGREGLMDMSRRPHRSPWRSATPIEDAILLLRQQHPAWGARKLRRRLLVKGALSVPAASTVHAILVRHGRIDPKESLKHRPYQRFEHDAPNRLWQMDFKGHFPIGDGPLPPLYRLGRSLPLRCGSAGLPQSANPDRQGKTLANLPPLRPA
jgi:transposase InsO family protein